MNEDVAPVNDEAPPANDEAPAAETVEYVEFTRSCLTKDGRVIAHRGDVASRVKVELLALLPGCWVPIGKARFRAVRAARGVNKTAKRFRPLTPEELGIKREDEAQAERRAKRRARKAASEE